MDKNGPGPSKVFGSDFYDLADPLLDQNFPRSYGYDVTFTNFQEGEKFIEDVIGSDQRGLVDGYPVSGRIMIGITSHEIGEPGASIHKNTHQLLPP